MSLTCPKWQGAMAQDFIAHFADMGQNSKVSRRGTARSLFPFPPRTVTRCQLKSLARRRQPSRNPGAARYDYPAALITQEDIGGGRTDFINDVELRNAPDANGKAKGDTPGYSGYSSRYGYYPGYGGYAPGYGGYSPGYGYGYNPGGLGGPASGLGVRPGMGLGGYGPGR
jgi:hypothetical protein